MTTMEHLFMQIFDRKKWIEGQLRQQEESFSQSAAYNLLAAGLKPPAWLFDGGSEAPGCSEKEDFSREQIISDILFRPGWATTPSTNHHTLYSLPSFKNTSIPHLNIFSSQLSAQNEQVPSKHIGSIDPLPEAAVSEAAVSTNLAFESSFQFDPPATVQRSRSRQRNLKKRMTENEIAQKTGGENSVEPLEEYICLTEVPRTSEDAHLGSDKEHLELNVKNTAVLESQPPLIWSVTNHSSAETLKSVGSDLSHLNNQGETFKRLVASRIGDVTANFQQEGSQYGVEKDNELVEVGFCTRSSSSASKQNLSISSSAKKFSLESSKVDIYQSSERLKEKQTRNAEKPDGPASQNPPLESGYFLRSSASHRNSITTPFKLNTTSSSNTSKQNLSISSSAKNKTSLESRKVDIYQNSERLEENQTCDAAKSVGQAFQNVPLEPGYFLRSSSHRKSITPPFKLNTTSSSNTNKQNLSISSSAKNISLESSKVEIYQISDRLKEKQACNAEKLDGPSSQTEPLESRYFLRSSASHSKSITTTFKFNTGSLKRPLQVIAHTPQVSWPKRRKMTYHSNVFASSPILRRNMLINNGKITYSLAKMGSSSPSHEQIQICPSQNRTIKGIEDVDTGSHFKVVQENPCLTEQIQPCPSQNRTIKGIEDVDTGSHLKVVQENPCLTEQIQPCPSQNMTIKGIEDVDTGIHFKVVQENPCLTEDFSYLQSAELLESQAESTLGIPSGYVMDENVNVSMQEMIEVDQSTLFRTEDCDISVGYHGPFYNYELGNISSETLKHDKQFVEELEMNEEVTDSLANEALKSPNHDDGQMACNDFVPEFEGFSIGFPSIAEECSINSECQNLVEGRVSCHEQMRSSMHIVTPKSSLSRKYKINMLPDVFQSSRSEILEPMNLSDSFHFDSDPRHKLWKSQDAGYCSLDLDFLRNSNSYGMSSPGARSGREAKRPHLTPLVGKSNIKMISGRKVDSLGAMGSKPELACFRIDENTSTSEDNEFADELDVSGRRSSSREINMPVNRKALFDITSSYGNVINMAPITDKNMEGSSLQSTESKSFTGTQSITHFSLGTAYTNKQNQRVDMENRHALTNGGNKDQQAGQSLHKMPSKPKLSETPVERNKGSAVIGNGCKPSNVVSNISSFIPLIPRKQQETPAKGKKDIKVKALGAAQAAKLLEEKKRNEREKRKEAAKLERLRLEEEKKLKQKQIEEKQRKEADLAARKRQRDEEDRKKERKRRCIKESQRMQRPQEERPDPEKGGKEMRHKHADEDKQKLGLRQEAQHHVEQVIGGNFTRIAETAQAELSTTKVISNLDNLRGIIQDRMSTTQENQDFQSYEMTPYRDSSDEEDGEDENIRARKHIPLWARKGHLEQGLRSVQFLDDFFSQKDSFDMCEVLGLNVSRRPE